jgi:hypothetical protein
LEKAIKNQAVIDAIGEPIVKGPWYNASLAVAHKRHSVSCTFPVSGPQGSGVLQVKAVRDGGLFSPSIYCLYLLFCSGGLQALLITFDVFKTITLVRPCIKMLVIIPLPGHQGAA